MANPILSSPVSNLSYSESGVAVRTANNTCHQTPYAICTFSLGVLQQSISGQAPVSFSLAFPTWKQGSIFTNLMGMYTIGLEPFRAQHARIFATIYKGSRISQKIERIAFIRDDVAVVHTLTQLQDVAHLPPGFAPGSGMPASRLKQVMVEDAGVVESRGLSQRLRQSRSLAVSAKHELFVVLRAYLELGKPRESVQR